MSVTEQTQSIEEQFANAGVEVDSEEVEERFDTLVNEYLVPEEEARRSLINSMLDEHDIEERKFFGRQFGNDTVGCGDIDEDEQWIDVEAQVVQLWEPKSDSMAQVGLLGDESGTVKFVSWKTSDLQELEEGASYSLGNVVTDEYEDQYSVKLNSTTEIEHLDKDIEPADDFGESEPVTSEGVLVKIKSGSGLIKRCDDEDCTRVLNDGYCSEHGENEGEFDLRIKGALDDGCEVQSVIFDAEATEAVSGMAMDEAIDLAMDTLDTTVVAGQLRDQLVGQYYEVEGREVNEFILVDECETLTEDDSPEEEATKLLHDHFEAEIL